MMEHEAFLFDYSLFDRELRSMLDDSLEPDDTAMLQSFINANLNNLRYQYDGEPLTEDWETMIETRDAHQYGDFALTKYYDPKTDLGLGAGWDTVHQMVANDPAVTESPVLGSPVGPADGPFDPGKMGSYFQSAQQVQRNYFYLVNLGGTQSTNELSNAIKMLKEAVDSGSGLYVTF